MQILLLAAGLGSRLGFKTQALPKTLIPINGKPLLHRVLDSLLEFPLGPIWVVAGFEHEKLLEALVPYKNVEIVLNPDFREGNLLTLLCGRGKVSAPFAVFNSDHFYSPVILGKIFKYEGKEVTAVCDFDRPLTDDDMKVHLKGGRLAAMSKKLKNPDAGYVGVTLVPAGRAEVYWQNALAVLDESGRQSHAEMVLNRLTAKGEAVEILDVSGSTWFEVDTPEDLTKAEAGIR